MENIETLIGKRINSARTFKKLTQEQLAERCSMSVSAISRIETGHNSTTLKTLINIANALEVGIDYLLYDLISPHENQQLAPQTQEAVSILNQMSEQDRQLALEIILSISKHRNI